MTSDLCYDTVPVPSVDVELLDLLDSASSVNKPRGCGVMVVMDLVNRTAAELQNADRVHSDIRTTQPANSLPCTTRGGQTGASRT